MWTCDGVFQATFLGFADDGNATATVCSGDSGDDDSEARWMIAMHAWWKWSFRCELKTDGADWTG